MTIVSLVKGNEEYGGKVKVSFVVEGLINETR
jgi:hypothetical protein